MATGSYGQWNFLSCDYVPEVLNYEGCWIKGILLHLKTVSLLSVQLTHCGPVTQICVFTLQLCKTD